MDLSKLIDIIPKLFVYIIPGYIAILMKQKFKHEKEESQSNIIIISIIISYIIVQILDDVIALINLKIKFELNNNLRTIIILILSVLFGLAWTRYKDSIIEVNVKKLLRDNTIEEPNVWNYAMRCSKGAWVRVYISDDDITYIGKLIYYTIDPNDERKEILLASYTSIKTSTEKEIENYNDDKKMVLINCKDIKYIEILKS